MIIYASHTPKQGFLLLLIYKKEILLNMENQTNSSSCVRGGGTTIRSDGGVCNLGCIYSTISTLPPPKGYSLYLRGRIFVGFQISSFNFHLSSLTFHLRSYQPELIVIIFILF